MPRPRLEAGPGDEPGADDHQRHNQRNYIDSAEKPVVKMKTNEQIITIFCNGFLAWDP